MTAPSLATADVVRTPSVFANPAVVSAGWYIACRTGALKEGHVRSLELGPRKLALFRDPHGRPCAMDAQCAHLGADLCDARLEEGGLRCAFHGWCWEADGSRRGGGNRRQPTFQAREAWGFVWVWVGPSPPGPFPRELGPVAVRLPRYRLPVHPHLVLSNGLDLDHYGPVHGLHLDPDTPVLAGPDGVLASLKGRIGDSLAGRLLGIAGRRFEADFCAMGGSVSWFEVHTPVRFGVLFSGRPTREGTFDGRGLLFVQARRQVPRAAAVLALVTKDDTRILQGLRWDPGFTPTDRGLAAYARYIEGLPAW